MFFLVPLSDQKDQLESTEMKSSFNRKPTKKEIEKQKLIEEKEAEAAVLQQFVETFEKPNSGVKTFVRGTTINGPIGGNF